MELFERYFDEGLCDYDAIHLERHVKDYIENLQILYESLLRKDVMHNIDLIDLTFDFIDRNQLYSAASSVDDLAEGSVILDQNDLIDSDLSEGLDDNIDFDFPDEGGGYSQFAGTLKHPTCLSDHWKKHTIDYTGLADQFKTSKCKMLNPEFCTDIAEAMKTEIKFISVDDCEDEDWRNWHFAYPYSNNSENNHIEVTVGYKYDNSKMPMVNLKNNKQSYQYQSYFGYAMEIFDKRSTLTLDINSIRTEQFVNTFIKFLQNKNEVLHLGHGIFSNGHDAKIVHSKLFDGCFDIIFLSDKGPHSLFCMTPLGLMRYFDRAGILIIKASLNNTYKILNMPVSYRIFLGTARASAGTVIKDIEREYLDKNKDYLQNPNECEAPNPDRYKKELEFYKGGVTDSLPSMLKKCADEEINYDQIGLAQKINDKEIKDFINAGLIFKYDIFNKKSYYFKLRKGVDINSDDAVGTRLQQEIASMEKLKNKYIYSNKQFKELRGKSSSYIEVDDGINWFKVYNRDKNTQHFNSDFTYYGNSVFEALGKAK